MNETSPAATDDRPVARGAALPRLYGLLRAVAAAIALAMLVWLLGGLVMVIFAAVLLATILHGLAHQLRRVVPLPHWAALTVVVLVIGAAFAALAITAGPALAEQARQLRDALVGQSQALQDRLNSTDWGKLVLSYVPQSLGGESDKGLPALPTGFANSVLGILASVVGLFGTLAVVLIAAIYLAADPDTYLHGALRLIAPDSRPKARELFRAGGAALAAWSAGQAVDMLVVGILCGVGLYVIGVPLAFVLGVVAGLTNFVPYIGAIGGAIPAVIIAFAGGVTPGVETIALYLAVQGFEGNVLAPLIQNRTVNLPPALTILSQTAFGAILGLPGLIFATPLTAMLMAVLDKATPPLRPEDKD